ncbi:MAG: XF1762 family protein [Acidimicrobiales bacterium]
MTVADTEPSAVACGRLRLAPSTVTEARRYVTNWHRHLPIPPAGARWAVCVVDDTGAVHGVAMVGWGARMAKDRQVATVTRVATDGTPNVCSMLYGACGRVWRAMGGTVLYTFTLKDEVGTSLRAAGWAYDGITKGGEWSRSSRARPPAQQPGPKHRWVWRGH